MDKLEAYLEQVCRGIAGPRSLRQHIRRELAEHLRDAAAEHEAAGMGKQEALARALEDFGGPEQVRAEFEATHGHRVMTVVVDKALQWKEMTMKAKWIWSTWAHVVLIVAVVAELAFLYGCVIFMVPRFRALQQDGWFDKLNDNNAPAFIRWLTSVVNNVASVCHSGIWLGLLLAVIWGLFEWRVRSENKTLMRLAALGTAAMGLAVTVFFMGAALILPLMVTAGPSSRIAATRVAATHIVQLDESMRALDAAIAAKDWETTQRQVEQVRTNLWTIWSTGLGQPVWDESVLENGSAFDAQFHAAYAALYNAGEASRAHDEARFEAAMQAFRKAYGQMRPAATQTGAR